MTAGGAWPSADNPQPSQTTPDFDAMTHQERDRWLKNPLVSAPWGSNLDPDPVDSGTATVTTCHPFFSYPCT